MAGTITALEVQKRDKERVNVFLDGQFAFGVTLVAAAALKKGQYLSDTEIEQLRSQDDRDKAYNSAVRFLGYRARSQRETEQYLRGKKYPPEVVEDTVNRLLDQGYLDDEAFARFWLENRELFRPRSQQALRYELKQKGIADEIIETILADVDEMESAWAAVESKIQRWKNLTEEDFRKKVVGFLSRRGFSYEIAGSISNRAWTSLDLTKEEREKANGDLDISYT